MSKKKPSLLEMQRQRRESQIKDKARRNAVKVNGKNVTDDEIAKEVAKLKKSNKKERFETLHMWIYYLVAMFNKDRGTIPENIGDKILITTNMYITKLYLNSMFIIDAMGLETPHQFMECCIDHMRANGSSVVVDFTFKRRNMAIDSFEGIKSRRATWEAMADSDEITDAQKEVAARGLYTSDKLMNGQKLYYTRIIVTLRAKTGAELIHGEKTFTNFCVKIRAKVTAVNSNVREVLQYSSMISDAYTKETKDLPAVITSSETLSQMVANTAGFNGPSGLFIGYNLLNNTHFNIDFEKITIARNVYIVAPAGVGKTVLAINMAESALEHDNWRVCANDIKGNEWTRMCHAVNGVIVSLTPQSKQYINTWRMNPDNVDYNDALDYFNNNFNMSKEVMITLTGAKDSDVINEMDLVLDKFLKTMYTQLGVLATNKNTWHNTENLTPFDVYDKLCEYMTPTMLAKYKLSGERLVSSLRPSMSRNGSRSYIFSQEFDLYDVLKAKMVVFNYGLLGYDSVSDTDAPVVNLKFLYGQKINAEYVKYNYNNGIETMKILEESQIVPPEVMKRYVQDFTLRRAQRQTTILLGNSIQALKDNTLSKPLIENTRALFIGDLPGDARRECIKSFDLQEYEKLIQQLGSTEETTNAFLFINRMEKEPIVPIIKLKLDTGKKYMQFTPTSDLSGNS